MTVKMMSFVKVLVATGAIWSWISPVLAAENFTCPDYNTYSTLPHAPYSKGKYRIPYQRPEPACRTFNSSVVEQTIKRMKSVIKDPDLYQLFSNVWPNTLDTAVLWRGVAANNSDEELAFLITGDINAMWLRDSANQLAPYATLLKPATPSQNANNNNSLASLFRGAINLQARYISKEPWCSSFQPPVESGLARQNRSEPYTVTPPFPPFYCFTPNFELDSFGAFFQLSHDYYNNTGDISFFGKFQWADAVRQILHVAKIQMEPFYNPTTGAPLNQTYTFNSETTSFTGSLGLYGLGNPVRKTGMIKAPFRPSDDSSIYQFLVPSNMMFSQHLLWGAEIMKQLSVADSKSLASEMMTLSASVEAAIEEHGVVPSPGGSGKKIYAYEVDGYGGQNLMDDANIPSLLSAPFIQYVQPGSANYQTYLNTREFILSLNNPWFSMGPNITGIGSPHTSIGRAWPMALIDRILTSNDTGEIVEQLQQLVSTTDGLGLIHESINSRNVSDWTRQWFGWANGLFGQMILDLNERKPDILGMSFQ